MTLSPEAQKRRAEMAAEREQRRLALWTGDRPLVDSAFGARTLGSLAEAGVGMELFTNPARRRDWREDGIGGIIVDGPFTTADHETGELRRSWKVYDPAAPSALCWYRIIHESDVPVDGVTIPEPSSLVLATRRMARAVGMRDSHLLVGWELDALTYATRLGGVVLGGR